MSQPNNKISKSEVIKELWYRGNLSWKLNKNQKELYDLFHTASFKTQTWLLARRSGKTFCLALLAIEQCIKKPGSIIKFLSPTKIQVNTNLRPIMKIILEDCPNDIKPEFKNKDYIYYFPNGSEIQLAGSESGHAEKLRGGSSQICIIDEAGDVTDLEYIIKSVLLPTTLTTKGKVLIAGTPPKTPDHDFIKYIEEAQMRGSLIKKTVYDNPMLTQKDIEELIEELGGLTSESARRELLCEIIRDSNTCVVPEFTDELKKKIVVDHPKPPYYDAYVSMDLGGKDLTVVLFGYYDFRADKIIIEDEIVMNFNERENTIEKLSQDIQSKEYKLWRNVYTDEVKAPYLRVSDIDYIVINEIKKYSNHKISFQVTKKDNKSAAIHSLRMLLQAGKILINPRCVTTIRHLENVKWKNANSKDEFARSPDDGHYDAVDALLYMVRNIAFKRNPYPKDYEINLGQFSNAYVAENQQKQNAPTYASVFKKMMNIKR